MSRIRTGHRPDDWRIADDGAVGRVTHTRGSITGGSIIVPSVPSDEVRREVNAAAVARYEKGKR